MSSDSPSLLPAAVRRSYATRLGLALAVAVLVMVGFGAVISAQTSATLTDDVEAQLQTQSETRADQLDTWLSAVQRDAAKTARFDAFAAGDDAAAAERLRSVANEESTPENVLAVHYVDASDGTVLASTADDAAGTSLASGNAPFAGGAPSFDGPDDAVVSRPFSSSVASHPVVAVTTPVPDAEDRALVYVADVEVQAVQLSSRDADSETAIVELDGRYVAHPNASKILSPHAGMDAAAFQSLAPGASSFMDHHDTAMAMTRMRSQDWVVMIHTPRASAYALGAQINSDLIGLVLLAVINLGLVGVTIGTNTIVSLRRLSDRASAMADGDLDVDLDTTREDEFGTLYRSFADMRDSIREKIAEAEQAREDAESARERAEVEAAEMERMNDHLAEKAAEYREALAAAAEGDLTRRVDPESDNEAMRSVGEHVNEALAAIEETIGEMKTFASNVRDASERVGENAERVDEASQQVTASIGEITDGASEQRDRLEDAAGEMENLSATAEEVASSAQEVATTSERAATAGEDGREAAQRAVEEMGAIEDETADTVRAINELDDELDEITEIVGLITQIVEQTNMLALNASIEAARADGEGDGFAVVADEIKGLAEETKEAAGDIEARVERIQSQAGETVDAMEATSERITDGVETVEEAVDALEAIVEHAEAVDTGVQEIDDATEEQATSAQEVMEAIDELTAISRQTATEADTVAGAAADQSESIGEVSASARELRDRASELDAALDRFETDTDGAENAALADD